jgi:hypothetical protein
VPVLDESSGGNIKPPLQFAYQDEALTIPEYCWLVATTQESTGRP